MWDEHFGKSTSNRISKLEKCSIKDFYNQQMYLSLAIAPLSYYIIKSLNVMFDFLSKATF